MQTQTRLIALLLALCMPAMAAFAQETTTEEQIEEATAAAEAATDAPEDTTEEDEAEDEAAPAPERDPNIGAVTNLPLPRYVSLKANEANIRRGPSTSHRVDWIFTRRDMPLQVVAEYGNWRKVIDRDGMGGWVHYIMLSGNRSVIITEDDQPLYSRPAADSMQEAILENNVIARLDECEEEWCKVRTGGFKGWVPKTSLWGVEDDEVFD